jgi:transcriptional regulator with XRE-family HTH domain
MSQPVSRGRAELLREQGERITQARKNAGLLQPQIAAAVGASVRSVSRWETGQSDPCLRDLELIAQVTGHDLRWLRLGAYR